MNINKLLLAFCAVSAILSCTREIDAPIPVERPQQGNDPAVLDSTVFTAVADPLNKTWIEGASVSVYDGVSADSLQFVVADVDGASCMLTGQVYSSSDLYVALYPSEAFSACADKVATLVVPAEQKLPDESADKALQAYPAVAIDAMRELEFSSLASYVSVYLDAYDVASFTLRAKNGAGLGGEADVAVYQKEVKTLRGTSDVTLKPCGDTFRKGIYFLQMLPGTYEEGLEVEMTFTDGTTYSHTLCQSVEVEFGKISATGVIHDDNFSAPSVSVSKVAFSSAELSWTGSGAVDGYNVYLNGVKVNDDVLPATQSTYYLTGMRTDADNTVEVESVGAGDVKKSPAQVVRTLGVRWIDAATRSVTIEWDETVEWPEAYTGGSIDASGKNGRGYQIAIYKDKDCAQEVYAVYPYWGSNCSYGNSSWYGKTGNCNYFVPTMLSMGYLEPNTTYYVRVRSVDDVTVGGMTLNNEAGTSEWSEPLEVKTEQSHVAEAGEVIFADFDELCFLTDRTHGCPGVIKDGDAYYVTSVGDSPDKNLNVYGVATAGTGTAGEYFSGSTFCAIGDPASRTYTNYIGNEGTALEGWHFSTNIRANMGALTIDRARNRFFGTPALTGNLTDEEKPCVLTFDFGAFKTGANSSYSMNVQRLREGSLETVAVLEFTGQYTTDSPTSTDYKIDYCLSEKKVELSLKSGDAVIISAKDATNPFFMVYDNFKIKTK